MSRKKNLHILGISGRLRNNSTNTNFKNHLQVYFRITYRLSYLKIRSDSPFQSGR